MANSTFYDLFFELDDSTKISVFRDRELKKVDEFTCNFENEDKMVEFITKRYLSKRINQKVVKCYIQLNTGKKTKYKILYCNDRFIIDRVILRFKEYCGQNEEYFENFKINIGMKRIRREDYTYFKHYVSRVCYVYFRDTDRNGKFKLDRNGSPIISYNRVRKAYLELKRLNQTHGIVLNNDDNFDLKEKEDNYFYYIDDSQYSYLEVFLGFDPEWDEISKWPDEIRGKIRKVEKENIDGKGRKLH